MVLKIRVWVMITVKIFGYIVTVRIDFSIRVRIFRAR